jgi:hypothetical protein
VYPGECSTGAKPHEGEFPMIEQIDGTSYTFDSDKCAMMFKRFSSVYGNNFADE